MAKPLLAMGLPSDKNRIPWNWVVITEYAARVLLTSSPSLVISFSRRRAHSDAGSMVWLSLEHWTDRAVHARMDMPSRPRTLKTSFHAVPTAQSLELCYSWYILFFTCSWVEMLIITLCVIFCLRYIFTAYLFFLSSLNTQALVLDMNPVLPLWFPQVKFLPLVSQVVIKPRAVTAANTH